ncbi:MAG: hypothetical protein RL685_4445 [Pseudomonadota bacterium]|jgi:hypothetical protein
MSVRDTQRGKPAALPTRIVITVGVHADDGAASHQAANDVRPEVANDTTDSLTVAEVATFHEFGVGPFTVTTGFDADGAATGYEHPGIPQRSFIRAWFDESQELIVATLQSQLALVVAGKLSAEQAAERIGLVFEGSVKQRISRGIPPPNARSTIERKGSSKPLIDTGQLRNAIRARAEVQSAGAELGAEAAE